MASCSHLIPKKLLETIPLVDFGGSDNCKNFVIYNDCLIIINFENLIEKCPVCDKLHKIYIYGNWPNDVYATSEGATNLTIKIYNYNIISFIYNIFSNEPRFGNFIFGGSFYYKSSIPFNPFIIYCKFGSFEKAVANKKYGILFNDKIVVCCRTLEDNIIVVDEDGKLLDIEVIYPDVLYTFKVGNGYLTAEVDHLIGAKWTYTNEPSYAKPVAN
jgi:hypothetical protein